MHTQLFSLNKSDIWRKDFFLSPGLLHVCAVFVVVVDSKEIPIPHLRVCRRLSLNLPRAAVGFVLSSKVGLPLAAEALICRRAFHVQLSVRFYFTSDSSQTGSTLCHRPVKTTNLQNVKLKQFEVTQRILKRQTLVIFTSFFLFVFLY